MATFVMLTRLSPGALHSPKSLESVEKKVSDRIREEVPVVE